MTSHSVARVVVLSLKQRWAAAIYDGAKTVEIRRRFPIPTQLPQRALIYTSSPIKSLTGEASITAVQRLPLEEIARDWIDQTCVSREELDAYLGDLGYGTLISLDRVQHYENPISLAELRERHAFTPPQSFAYARSSILAEVGS